MLDKLQKIYNDVAGREDLILTPKTKLNDLELSSLGLIHLILEIEDVFDLAIDNRSLARFKTVKDVVRYLEKATGE